jgi:hypothetical protein
MSFISRSKRSDHSVKSVRVSTSCALMPFPGLNQLQQPGAGAAHRAGEDIPGAQLLANLRRGYGLVAESENGGTREGVKSLDFGKLRDHILGDAVAQVLVFLDTALIFEIKHSHRLIRGSRCRHMRSRGLGLVRGRTPAGIQITFQALQVGAKLGGGLMAKVGIFFECLGENVFEGEGQFRIYLCCRSRLGPQDAVENKSNGRARERKPVFRRCDTSASSLRAAP